MAKYCAYCGHQMADADLFCANCGKRAGAAPAAQPQQPAAPQRPIAPQQPAQGVWQAPQQGQWQAPRQGAWTAAPAAQQPRQAGQWQSAPPQQPPQPWQPQHQAPRAKRGGKGLLIGVIAAVVVVALLVGGFVWPGFFKKDPGAQPPGAEDVTPVPVEETPTPAETPAVPRETPAPTATEPPAETAPPHPGSAPAAYQNPFTDVAATDWFYDAVMWAGQHGIVSGKEFKPGDLTNRGQALTFLWRSAGNPAPTLTDSPYSDVTEEDYFYQPVLWGYENGVISNSGDGMFHADGALTRAQAITFLCRAAGGSDTVGKRSFSDVREDNWYFASANWALANGVVGRDPSWAFKPDQQMTRAMFVTFLYRTFAEDAKKADGAEPAPEGLRDVGISINVDAQAPQTFRSVTKNGSPLAFTASVIDYRVFESDDAMPQREGFEWRVMTLEANADGLDGSGLRLSLITTDAYNVRLNDASRKLDDNNVLTFTVLDDGHLVDCTIWWTKLSDDNKGTSTWKFTASVPIGYDGVVVGFKNADVASSNRSIADYYTAAEDFALFRMK